MLQLSGLLGSMAYIVAKVTYVTRGSVSYSRIASTFGRWKCGVSMLLLKSVLLLMQKVIIVSSLIAAYGLLVSNVATVQRLIVRNRKNPRQLRSLVLWLMAVVGCAGLGVTAVLFVDVAVVLVVMLLGLGVVVLVWAAKWLVWTCVCVRFCVLRRVVILLITVGVL